MSRDCQSCLYGKRLYVVAYGCERQRCFRPRLMADKRLLECGRNGFDAEAERGDEPQPGRLFSDHCGPGGKNWEAAK